MLNKKNKEAHQNQALIRPLYQDIYSSVASRYAA